MTLGPIVLLMASRSMLETVIHLVLNHGDSFEEVVVIGKSIKVERGILQGGLTSTYHFHLVYQDMKNELNSEGCGIQIGKRNYSAF